MEAALKTFHSNKDAFIDAKIHEHFNISKLHNILHYLESICSLGSTDGYNTKHLEWLHIDYAKDAYRHVSHIDYIAQMTMWLQRQEAVHHHSAYICWIRNSQHAITDNVEDIKGLVSGQDVALEDIYNKSRVQRLEKMFIPSGIEVGHGYHFIKNCQLPSTPISRIHSDFLALDFISALQAYLKKTQPHSEHRVMESDQFNIYLSVAILSPSHPHVSDAKRLGKICAHPKIPNTNPHKPPKASVTNTALIVEDEGLKKLRGFGGAYISIKFSHR